MSGSGPSWKFFLNGLFIPMRDYENHKPHANADDFAVIHPHEGL